VHAAFAASITLLASCADGTLNLLQTDIDVDAIDMGVVYVGEEALRVVVHNNGVAPETIRRVTVRSDVLDVVFAPRDLPLAVASGVDTTVDVDVDNPSLFRGVVSGTLDVAIDSTDILTNATWTMLVIDKPDCNDDNACTVDVAVGASCQHTSLDDGTPCSDGSACTLDDVCASARCLGTPLQCDDDTDCTVDACDADAGCVFQPVSALCDDNNPCTDDVCEPGDGCSNPNKEEGAVCGLNGCVSLSLCTFGFCVDFPVPDGAPCSDGNACTTGDSCAQQQCTPGEGEGGLGLGDGVQVGVASATADPSASRLWAAHGRYVVWSETDYPPGTVLPAEDEDTGQAPLPPDVPALPTTSRFILADTDAMTTAPFPYALLTDPEDVVVDAEGRVWFAGRDDAGAANVHRADTGAFQSFGYARFIRLSVRPDGDIDVVTIDDADTARSVTLHATSDGGFDAGAVLAVQLPAAMLFVPQMSLSLRKDTNDTTALVVDAALGTVATVVFSTGEVVSTPYGFSAMVLGLSALQHLSVAGVGVDVAVGLHNGEVTLFRSGIDGMITQPLNIARRDVSVNKVDVHIDTDAGALIAVSAGGFAGRTSLLQVLGGENTKLLDDVNGASVLMTDSGVFVVDTTPRYTSGSSVVFYPLQCEAPDLAGSGAQCGGGGEECALDEVCVADCGFVESCVAVSANCTAEDTRLPMGATLSCPDNGHVGLTNDGALACVDNRCEDNGESCNETQ
jgi:Dictyostelium (slime mold) repeat